MEILSYPLFCPAKEGFRLPAEWEPHIATWLSWPRPGSSSFGGREHLIEPILVELVKILVQSEQVHICGWDLQEIERLRESFIASGLQYPLLEGHIMIHHFPAYEPWIRDHGPIFLVREKDGKREKLITNWKYNAWGGKYPPWDLDDQVPLKVAAFRDVDCINVDMVLEGGAIETNGAGLLLTTSSCILNPNRNPQIAKEQAEQIFKDIFGVKQIIWLEGAIQGDDTDGHIDQLARFVNELTVVVAYEKDPLDPNYKALSENLDYLRKLRVLNSKTLNVIPLPLPNPIYIEGLRMPASYLNFYISNKYVIVPQFGDPHDAIAIQTLQRLFPTRIVVGIDSRDIIWGLGSFHCLTQQEPL